MLLLSVAGVMLAIVFEPEFRVPLIELNGVKLVDSMLDCAVGMQTGEAPPLDRGANAGL